MIRLIRAGIIGLAGIFCCTVFAADSSSVKSDTKAVISEDILVDDDDEDLLKLSKDTTTAAKQVAPVQEIAKDTAKVVQPVVQNDSVTNKKAELDDVLILEGGADDLLGTAPKPKDTAVAEVKADTAKAGIVENKVEEPAPSTVVVEKPKTAPAAPVKIENTDSINFAKSLKNYRNPKIAMLLSLIFPGAGEVYSKNYVRAGIFGALEAGVIITGAVFNSKAKKEMDDAHDYADKHYSSEDLITFYSTFKNKFYPDPTTDKINEADSVFLEIVNIKPSSSTFSKSTPDFYDIIADSSSPYIQGWKDVTPKVTVNYDVVDSAYTRYKSSDTTTGGYDSSYLFMRKSDSLVTYGSSQYQYVYNDKVSKANKKFKVSQNIFTLMILNRVASAIDAGICAKAYNDKLLGKKSAWQRINVKDITVASGNGLATGYALEVRF